MAVTDPIADYLTRIRNATKAKKVRVEIPATKTKIGLSEILKNLGYIIDYEIIDDTKQKKLNIVLKYKNGVSAITGLKRISKPGLRVYRSSDKLPRVLNGLGTAVISTPKGLLTDKDARNNLVGGEVVCYIW
ncbi:MAG: 30S ribosomal protein S8 [Ignavibacteriota bacterium]|jgi:small subunit ribosomal protein S8|nr:30S ribosomal protein S8 [Ignavibacteriales bacterium]MBL1121790.1 30S ribosomal protein S8 [Ignavibacteriota bacterium]MBV6419853.1 30S ribosomal protein S8 [Ignavibacteriaceae bacterium]MCE7855320.1 30S ribosomal protein S8 [Ignavibacteria bacterium CHB3]MCC7093362.1 30S ribosomal protein S8 [Ignavibacteriaceae bacterium]